MSTIAIFGVYVPFFPPQIAGHPDLNATAHAGRGGYKSPGDDRSFLVFENGEGEVGSRPTYTL